VEGVHQDIVFGLKNEHIVKGARNPERHSITETALTEGINEEYGTRGCHGGTISDADPGAHT
jgi:hypothetical protein